MAPLALFDRGAILHFWMGSFGAHTERHSDCRQCTNQQRLAARCLDTVFLRTWRGWDRKCPSWEVSCGQGWGVWTLETIFFNLMGKPSSKPSGLCVQKWFFLSPQVTLLHEVKSVCVLFCANLTTTPWRTTLSAKGLNNFQLWQLVKRKHQFPKTDLSRQVYGTEFHFC